jgi:hypothetical protein
MFKSTYVPCDDTGVIPANLNYMDFAMAMQMQYRSLTDTALVDLHFKAYEQFLQTYQLKPEEYQALMEDPGHVNKEKPENT